jgi:glutathione synthase/RimK-type ligase-like ATP-grasp enzyme
MIQTKLIPALKLEDFPEKHLIREDSYYVQKFVNTGERPTHYRVYVFLDEILITTQSISKIIIPSSKLNIQDILKISIASNNQKYRDIILFKDKKIAEFALKVFRTFNSLPILGVDILIGELTNEMYALEVNAGGNTWAFSSEIADHFRAEVGGKKNLVLQYNAWDKAAEALVRKTHELAK